ncbi:hypothetical protein [Peribacillus sp. NPDC097295]|uniref:hypothetical protein n=1 Tax=Peribacillus sp. NPDC097295 TaxID=3364402 RepID=UPI00381D415B
MNVDKDSLVTFIIMWTVPIFMVARAYWKMDMDDKKSVIYDFSSRRFITTIGFMVMASFLMHVGNLFSISTMKVIGIILLILGGILSIFYTWVESKMKSICILVLLSVMIFLNVS